MTTRRDFLKTSTAAGLTASLPFPLLYSCTSAEPRASSVSPAPGLQLYTVRDLMEQSVPETLTAVAEAGYREVEFAGYFDQSPARIRNWLDDNGLTAPATHLPFEKLDSGWQESLDVAAVLGHRYLVIPWIPGGRRRGLDDYHRLAEAFNEAGRTARDAGFRFAYHNHDFEFASMDGQIPFDLLVSQTDPDLVEFELDIFWLVQGQGDPLDYFTRYPGRFTMLHVKDMAEDGSMVDVGDGVIDWATIFQAAGPAGIKHYFIEHDEPADSLESIQRSLQHLLDTIG